MLDFMKIRQIMHCITKERSYFYEDLHNCPCATINDSNDREFVDTDRSSDRFDWGLNFSTY